MRNLYKIFLVLTVVSFGLVLNQGSVLSAQSCQLTSAAWSTGEANVGNSLNLMVIGQGCNGWSVAMNIYEDDIFGDDYITEVRAVFQNDTSAVAKGFKFTRDDYTTGGSESDYEIMFFKATAGTSTVNSNNLTLNAPSTDSRGGGGAGNGGDTGGSRTGGGGGSTTELPNPIGINTFGELVGVIGLWIFNLAIPIAVIVIIYAGILMLTAGGNPGKFQKGAKALWYAVLGLAVVFIGKGFVTLIESILSLRNP